MNVALRILSLAVLGVCASARAEDLLVLERAPADHEASERLAELHDEPARVVADPSRDALELGRANGAVRVVVFNGADVSLVDVASGEQVTRTTADHTPYTAAFVAADLLALRPAPPPIYRFGVRLGLQLWQGAPFPLLARAELGLAVVHARWRLELFADTPGTSKHDQVLRTRSDLGLRAGLFVLTRERFRLAALGQLGAAWVRARIESPVTRTVVSAAVGLEPSVQIAPWLSLYALASLQLSSGRAAYQIAGLEVARESPLGVAFGLGLWVTPPFR